MKLIDILEQLSYNDPHILTWDPKWLKPQIDEQEVELTRTSKETRYTRTNNSRSS